jgi:hypothetical protein
VVWKQRTKGALVNILLELKKLLKYVYESLYNFLLKKRWLKIGNSTNISRKVSLVGLRICLGHQCNVEALVRLKVAL